jgi:hypothetical protein
MPSTPGKAARARAQAFWTLASREAVLRYVLRPPSGQKRLKADRTVW